MAALLHVLVIIIAADDCQQCSNYHYLKYFLQATDSEELTIVEGEELEILERDGDGWCKVKLYI